MMKRSIIKLCYRKIIGTQSAKPWEKMVFDDSYAEFRMQLQNYEQFRQYPSYGDLVHHVPEAIQLCHRVAPAVTGYIQQLNSIMPDILNNLGRRFIRFDRFHFEIINSHFNIKEQHQVAVNFYSVPLLWHATINNYLLVSFAEQEESAEASTHLMQLQPYLSICSLREEV